MAAKFWQSLLLGNEYRHRHKHTLPSGPHPLQWNLGTWWRQLGHLRLHSTSGSLWLQEAALGSPSHGCPSPTTSHMGVVLWDQHDSVTEWTPTSWEIWGIYHGQGDTTPPRYRKPQQCRQEKTKTCATASFAGTQKTPSNCTSDAKKLRQEMWKKISLGQRHCKLRRRKESCPG